MKDLLSMAVPAFVMMVVVGCGQGAGNTPSGSTGPTTSPGTSREQVTTAEQTTYVETNGLQCRSSAMDAAILDYAVGAKGENANPVELTQDEFSKSIEEGDTVEIADRQEGPNLRTVRVIRDGRVVAHITYRRGGEGWLLESYEACADSNIKPNF
jgi:hypothetical protein